MKTNILVVMAFAMVAMLSSCKKTEEAPINGCTDANALNYNKNATKDDGSCEIAPQKQQSLILNFTGTWCDVCGELGAPRFKQIYDENMGKVVPIEIHVGNDPMAISSTDFASLQKLFKPDSNGVTYTPAFVEAGFYTQETRRINGAHAVSIDYMNEWVKATAEVEPLANSWVLAEKKEDQIIIQTKTKFFNTLPGTYKIAAYIMENRIVAQQVGNPDWNEHNHVYRQSAGAVAGEVLAEEGTKGSVLEYTFKPVNIKPVWKQHDLYLVTVIYRQHNNIVNIVNVAEHPIK